jgi:transposase-like protein
MGKKLTDEDKKQIKESLLSGARQVDLARQFGVSKPLISQIKDKLDAEMELKEPQEAWLIEYVDQAVQDNVKEFDEPPVLAAVGFIVKENEEAIYLRQIWSKTTGENVRHAIIIKSTIKCKKRYVLDEGLSTG